MSRPDWYKFFDDLSIKNHSWTESTEQQVDFIIRALGLTGNEKILDLACGYGRHCLAFARRGYAVTGVDLSRVFIEDAIKSAENEALPVRFILSDIRDVQFENEFDVVLNMADGAVGYLENDAENLKIFDVIARALKPGGKHFMDIMNAAHAERFFPKRTWEIGEKALALAQFDWNPATRQVSYAGWDVPYGQSAVKPGISLDDSDPYRLYSLGEIEEIFAQRGMRVVASYCDFKGNAASDKEPQLLAYSQKL